MTTYALTGATGHLGALAVDELLKSVEPSAITVLVRDAAKAQDLADKGINVKVADYNNPESVESALEGIDRLLLISSNDLEHRFLQHKNVVDAAAKAGVSLIGYTSILKANTTANVLAPDHKQTEDYLMESGVGYILLRHGWYTENYLDAAKTAEETGVIISSAGNGKVASAARADYAAADVAALIKGDENVVFELAGDHNWGFQELAETISIVTGTKVIYEAVSYEEQVSTLESIGLPHDSALFVAALDFNISEGGLEDHSKALSSLTGRHTEFLEDTLRKALL